MDDTFLDRMLFSIFGEPALPAVLFDNAVSEVAVDFASLVSAPSVNFSMRSGCLIDDATEVVGMVVVVVVSFLPFMTMSVCLFICFYCLIIFRC